MGAELGATTSNFPADEVTKRISEGTGTRAGLHSRFADDDAEYAKVIDIDLSSLPPAAACPHSPDAVKSVRK